MEPEGVTYSLVMRMMDKGDLLYKGYHLGLDNYFSFPKLFLELFTKATVATGTVRKNGKGASQNISFYKASKSRCMLKEEGPLALYFLQKW